MEPATRRGLFRAGALRPSEGKKEISCVCEVAQIFCFSAEPGQTATFLLALAHSTEPWLWAGPAGGVLTAACGTT